MLSLNGKLLKLQNMTVGMSMELKDQDMSGQSSSTDNAEQGDKGKKFSFSCVIPFSKIETLTLLYQLASAKNADGERQIYRIGNELARSLKIREVKFIGTINALEHSRLLAWSVNFELREYNGVAEQKENRAKQQTKATQIQNTRLQQALLNAGGVGL